MNPLRKSLSQAAAPVSIIGAVGGFVADVLAPLGNFAPAVAILSAIAAILAFLAFTRHRRTRGPTAWDSPVAGALVISLSSTVVFTFWSALFAVGPERGYLAENIDPIAQIQADLLNLQEDVTAIRETTEASATQVVAVSMEVGDVGEDVEVVGTEVSDVGADVNMVATAQAQGFADIQAAFADLQAGQGTLVTNPTTPQEWYSNARLYQLRGDTLNALRAYEGYFAFDLEYVDPFLEYSALLRATEGVTRAREAMTALQQEHPANAALELALALLLETPDERVAQLAPLAGRLPNFGPAFFYLGEELTKLVSSGVTGDLLQRQADAYQRVLDLEEQQQGFSRYFIDKAIADDHLQTAQTQLATFATARDAFADLKIQIYYNYNGVEFFIITPEVGSAQQFLFSIDDPQPKTETGRQSGFVKSYVGPIAVPEGDHTFYLQIVDANGTPSEVYSQPFRVDPIAVRIAQQPTDFSTNTIPVVFVVGILGSTGAEPYNYRYSVDDDSLSESHSGFSITNFTVEGLTPGDHTLYIQATAEDGTQTGVVEFPFTLE